MTSFAERIVIPGDHLGPTSNFSSFGDGVFERGGHLFAAVVGLARVLKTDNNTQLNVYRVDDRPTIVPKLGDVVLGKVLLVYLLSLDLTGGVFAHLVLLRLQKLQQNSPKFKFSQLVTFH